MKYVYLLVVGANRNPIKCGYAFSRKAAEYTLRHGPRYSSDLSVYRMPVRSWRECRSWDAPTFAVCGELWRVVPAAGHAGW